MPTFPTSGRADVLVQLPRLVIVLSAVSLFNDAASEMITPLLPLLLTTVLGAGAAAVGLIEGTAEAAASVLKYLAGRLADQGWNPRRLVLSGYGLSSLARPLIALCGNWLPVMALRLLDRAGKGVRTAPRDALLAASVTDAERGHAFGFHRGMDHVGSIIGPLLATALLTAGATLRQVFLLSVVPGLLTVGLLFSGLRDHEAPAARNVSPPLRWRELDARLRALIVAAGGLALAVTPEAFLVLWATQHGVAIARVPILWAVASAVKAAVAYGGGRWSDRIGRLPLLIGGWTVRVAVLITLAFVPASGGAVWTVFLLYAATLAVSEGPERALIGDAAPLTQRSTAFGLYHLSYGLLALPGGLIFGTLWQVAGSRTAFMVAAFLTTCGILAMLAVRAKQP